MINNQIEEVWKKIDKYNNYEINNFGQVKSLKNKKILKTRLNKNNGYLIVNLGSNPKLIHRLLYESFNNYIIKEDECIHHINGNKLDNTLNNLKLMKKIDHNILHNKKEINPFYRKKHSEKTKNIMSINHIDVKGENNPNSVLNKSDVVKIKIYLNENKLTLKKIAEKFGIKKSAVSKIKTGRTWKHINGKGK